MASPSLEPLLALGLPLLLARWGRVGGQVSPAVSTTWSTSVNTTTTPSGPSPGSNGGLSQEATTAIIVLREKRQTEGTYRPSSEEQFSHAAEARAPQDSKETVRGCLPI
ncbi:hypothetical protein E5288_WYG002644 [Bos mutus]|uniref:Uncharacterized protein n=1 Tax=Bos mutus TaxID=72004 RepID=A0A6B0R658_9CETA|nr:hypothetical protein [Bos mutus]